MDTQDYDDFYKQDKKHYNINTNKNFNSWLENKINNGYHPFISMQEIQNMIEIIEHWYEIKYPNHLFMDPNLTEYSKLSKIIELQGLMTHEQLLYRLNENQVRLLDCNFRELNDKNNRQIKLNDIESYVYIVLKKDSDIIKGPNFKTPNKKDTQITSLARLSLHDLYSILKGKDSHDIDYTSLREVIYDNLTDIELRNMTLSLIAEKMLYSKRTNPKMGYSRAVAFINEFNGNIPGLNFRMNLNSLMPKKDKVKDKNND